MLIIGSCMLGIMIVVPTGKFCNDTPENVLQIFMHVSVCLQ